MLTRIPAAFSLGLSALVGEGDHYPTDPRYVLVSPPCGFASLANSLTMIHKILIHPQVGVSGDNLVFTSGEALFSAIQSALDASFDSSEHDRLTVYTVRANLYGPRSATEAALELFSNVRLGIAFLAARHYRASILSAATDTHTSIQGSVKARVTAEPIENVNKIIDELRAYEVSGRKVLQINELEY